jgi:hypothetical protein
MVDLAFVTCISSTRPCLPNKCGDFKLIRTLLLAKFLRPDIIPTLTFSTLIKVEILATLGKVFTKLWRLLKEAAAGK